MSSTPPTGGAVGEDGRGSVADEADGDVLVIAPSSVRAAGWTIVGAFAIGASGWAAGRAESGVVMVVSAVVLMVAVPLTGAFALQVFAPSSWTLRLGHGRLQGHALGMPVDMHLGSVRSLRLRRVLGDRALVVETRRGRRRLPLPLGADAHRVERAIERAMAARDERAADGSLPPQSPPRESW